MMSGRRHSPASLPHPALVALLLWASLLCAAPRSAAAADPAAALVAERNALLLKLLSDEDPANTRRAIQQLFERRAQLQSRAEQSERTKQQRQAELARYQHSLDYEAAGYCRLAVDPKQPRSDRYHALDWGRVVRKTRVALSAAPEDLQADPEVPIYEVQGQSERYFVDASDNPSFQASVGDLVALCRYKQTTRGDLPAPWNGVTLTSSRYSGRIAQPPRIVDKAAWNPAHITDQELRDAIQGKRWELAAGRYALALVRVEQDLGGGRFAMVSRYWQDPFVLEVPPTLPRRELLQPGEFVWVIVGKPRFDREQQKLVFIAADIELRYLVEP